MHTVRFLLVGLGNLGRRFCEILVEKEVFLRRRYELDLRRWGPPTVVARPTIR